MTRSSEAFDAVDIIRIKRDKGVLSPAQIDWTIDAYTRGAIADEQMAALNMAILLNGMDRAEISRWTAAMIASGERMDFSSLRRPDGGVKPTSDKHLTGGVGDKITLPLAPLVAVFGVAPDDTHYYYVRPDLPDAAAIASAIRAVDYRWSDGRVARNFATRNAR